MYFWSALFGAGVVALSVTKGPLLVVAAGGALGRDRAGAGEHAKAAGGTTCAPRTGVTRARSQTWLPLG